LIALDAGEVAQAEAELALGAGGPALDFANHMRDAHSLHADQVQGLLSDLQLAPAESAVSDALRAEAQAGLDEISRAPREDVDFTYLRIQLKMHAAGSVLVGRLADLAPHDSQLVELLRQTSGAIAEHRTEAEDLLRDR
jgi:GAF domain-containing protein